MPIDFRKFKRKIESAGYFLKQTGSNHYLVKAANGDVLEAFAVSHGRRTKGGEVWDSYVRLIIKAIKKYEEENKRGS